MFNNRQEAGRLLGQKVVADLPDRWVSNPERIVVVGLPRGGVPVAVEVAKALGACTSILVSKKIGAPFQPEFTIGAVTSAGIVVLNEEVGFELKQIEDYIESETARLTKITQEKERKWLDAAGLREPTVFRDRIAVNVDDGVATGMTALAAVRSLRHLGAAAVLVAVPVMSRDAYETLSSECDQVVCLHCPAQFRAVGQFYVDFHQVDDDEVTRHLRSSPPSQVSGVRPGN